MNVRQFFNNTARGYILKQALLLTAVIIALVMLANMFMRIYTHYGESETVPDLKGMTEAEAAIALEAQGLDYEIVDSVFDQKLKKGIVMEQTPTPGCTMKRNRPVYLTINAHSVRQVPIPDIRDMSYRQAEAMLKAVGFVIDKVEQKPSDFKDLVLDIRHGGRSLNVGDRLGEGTGLTLVIGTGTGEGSVAVPDLRGRTLQEAQRILANTPFALGGIDYEDAADTATVFYVFWQNPPAKSWGAEGMRINIKLSTDKDRTFFEETISDRTEEEEEFF